MNAPGKKHKVESICSVPLSLVQRRSLLHQVLQRPGIHLQAADQVVHVRLTGLVVQVTVWEKKEKHTSAFFLSLCYTYQCVL